MSEIEENGSLSFLDITITRENNKFVTSVYRKPTFSGIFTNFESFVPEMHKRGLIETLLHRIFRLCSSYENFHREIETLKSIFKHSNYQQFKDLLEKKIRSGIIYCYTCSNCKVTYYGKTFCHFYTRAAEHMEISNFTGKYLKNIKQSVISDHLLQYNCAINFDDFSILATDCNKFKLLLRESLLIKRD